MIKEQDRTLNFKNPPLQYAEFTQDMLRTMIEYFDFFADVEGVLSVEVNELGLWVEEPASKAKKFIGKARYSQKDIRNMRRAQGDRQKH
ncbi:hypothetical protein [Profundibacter sp.]